MHRRNLSGLGLASALWMAPLAVQAQSLTPPEVVTFVPAEYPKAAQAAGVEADVGMELTVEADGTVSEVLILKPAGYGFDEAAVAAVKQFIFKPATQDGAPIRARIPYRYRFSLAPRGKATNPAAAPLDPGDGTPPREAVGSDIQDALPPGVMRGRVMEKGARSVVGGAQVFARPVVKTGEPEAPFQEAVADAAGRFELRGLRPGPNEIKVIATDYEALLTTEEIPAEGTLEVTLRLRPTVEQEYGLVVRGQKEEQDVTRRVITADELARLPGTQGDVLRGLQNLPGVARPPLSGGVLIVRGSAPEDTQTFLNGMPIPLLYHFGGLNAVVSSDLLTQIDFLPGVFSARYGRALGAVIDASSAPGKEPELHGSVDTDIFDTGVYVQGPIGQDAVKKDSTFAVAARRSYADALLPVALGIANQEDRLGFTTAPRYWDYQVTAGTKMLGGKGQILAFGSSDVLELLFTDPAIGEQFFSSSTLFHQIQATWSKQIAPGVKRSAAVSTGLTRLAFQAPPFFTFELENIASAARLDWANVISDRVALSYGLDTQLNVADVAVLVPGENNTNIQNDIEARTPNAAAYVEARLTPVDGLIISPGVRADYFGGSDSFTVDPRLQARWTIDLKTAIKGGVGVTHQDPQPQELDLVFGDPTLIPERATQVALGIERQFWGGKITSDLSFYYKYLDNLVTQDGSGQTIADVTTNDEIGRVRGMELLLRYPPDARFFGWVAYSLSKAERQDPDDEGFRLFGFDQTHVLTALGTYNITADWSVGFRFRYSTGNPDTPIVGGIFDSDDGSYFPVNGDTNSIRVPAFHQLDLRVDKTFRYDRWKLAAYLELLNTYNRQNPEAFFYNFDFTQQGTFNGLPILPVLGVRGEF